MAPKYTDRYIRSLGYGITRGRQYAQEGQRLKQLSDEKIVEWNGQKDRIKSTSLEEWYNSLNDIRNAQMIRESSLRTSYFEDDRTTMITDNNNLDLSSDFSQASYNEVIILNKFILRKMIKMKKY